MLRVRTVLSGYGGAPYLSTMYFGNSGSLTNAQNANTAAGTFWGTVDNQLGNTLSWTTAATVEDMSLAGSIVGSYGVTPQTGTGTLSGTLEASVLQAVLQLRTGFYAGGREVRGRLFIPCMMTANNSSGLPSTTFKNAINAAAATLIADVNADWVIWSKKISGTASIIGASTWAQFGVLRSRRD